MSVADISTIIVLRYPSAEEGDRLNSLIELAEDQTDSTTFGTNYDLAVALRVLHWLSKGGPGGAAAGAVISEKEGDLARNYVDPGKNISLDDLDSSSWGQELKLLMKCHVFGPRTRLAT